MNAGRQRDVRRSQTVRRREQLVDVAGMRLRLVGPADPDELLDEDAFERDEFLPYWAELWPSALALADAVPAEDVRGRRVVELGCGLALPSVVAARHGARALATDWSADALAFARRNARLNGAFLRTSRCAWDQPDDLVADGPFDLVLASDVLYEARHAGPLLGLLPRLGPRVLLADPGRPGLRGFLAAAAREWEIEREGLVYRLASRS